MITVKYILCQTFPTPFSTVLNVSTSSAAVSTQEVTAKLSAFYILDFSVCVLAAAYSKLLDPARLNSTPPPPSNPPHPRTRFTPTRPIRAGLLAHSPLPKALMEALEGMEGIELSPGEGGGGKAAAAPPKDVLKASADVLPHRTPFEMEYELFKRGMELEESDNYLGAEKQWCVVCDPWMNTLATSVSPPLWD